MILSQQLWNMLHTLPFGHPLYRYTLRQDRPLLRRPRWWLWFSDHVFEQTWFLMALLLFIMPAIMMSVLIVVPPVAAALLVIPIALPLWFPLFVQILLLMWGARVSNEIAFARREGMYDLLCVMPRGSLSVDWILALGMLRRNQLFERVDKVWVFLRRLFLLGGGSVLTFLLLAGLSAAQDAQELLIAVMAYLLGMSIVLIAVIDFPQAMVLSVLMGLYMPSRFTHDSPLATATATFGVQIGLYLLALITGALFPPLALLILFGGREIIIRQLWRRLSPRYGKTWLTPDVMRIEMRFPEQM